LLRTSQLTSPKHESFEEPVAHASKKNTHQKERNVWGKSQTDDGLAEIREQDCDPAGPERRKQGRQQTKISGRSQDEQPNGFGSQYDS